MFFSTQLRKSQEIGKSAKKGFKNRFKKLRRKQGRDSSSSTVNALITSGESDSEPTFEPETDFMFNSGGIIHKFVPSTTTGSSKSSLTSRPKLNPIDPSLPPQFPSRQGNTGTHGRIGSSVGGGGNLSGPEYSGLETPKESSAVRFKDLFKSVGLSNPGSGGSTPTSVTVNTTAMSGGVFPPGQFDHYHPGSQTPQTTKPPQSRSTFQALGELLSGDDQPAGASSSSKGFPLKGTEKRKKRFTKKTRSHTVTAAEILANISSSAITDDEDSSASRTGRRRMKSHHDHRYQHQNQNQGQQQQQNNRGFLHHFHQRYRSRSTGEEGRAQALAPWRPGP
ncbi:hypothetical protein BGZ65_007863, partial [Modicella reniformis]